MSFLAVLLALLLEQVRPLRPNHWVSTSINSATNAVLHHFDNGRKGAAIVSWLLAVALPAGVCMLVHWLLWTTLGFVAVLIWHVAVLFVCLGFRQFSFYFTQIRDALDSDEDESAWKIFQQWQPFLGSTPWSEINTGERNRNDARRDWLMQSLIEQSVLAAHRHVLAVLLWYAVLAVVGMGPAGAVLYRQSDALWHRVRREDPHAPQAVSDALHAFYRRAWEWMNWLPARMTALGFAITGNFEDAIDSWRRHKQHDANSTGSPINRFILAVTAGALNLQLGLSDGNRPRAELAHLKNVVGLLWRTVVLWLLLIALLTLANLLG